MSQRGIVLLLLRQPRLEIAIALKERLQRDDLSSSASINHTNHGGHRLTSQLLNGIHKAGPSLNHNVLRRYRVVPPNTPPRVAKDARETHETINVHKRARNPSWPGENFPRNEIKSWK